MTPMEKLEHLKSLESMADDCIQEISNLLEDNSHYNTWYKISDNVKDSIATLEAEIEFNPANDPEVKKYLDRKPYCLKEYDMEDEGIWEVRGEDSNCDLGGHHHNPYLFTAEGTLIDVIKKAVHTKGFWAWGAGGEIKKIEIEKI